MQLSENQNLEQKKQYSVFVSGIPPSYDKESLILVLNNFIKNKIISLNLVSNNCKDSPQIANLFLKSEIDYKNLLNVKKHRLQDFENYTLTFEPLLKGKNLYEKEIEVEKRKICILRIFGKISNFKLKEIFEQFGKVELAYVKTYSDNENKCIGFITFEDQESAEMAVNASFKLKINNVKVKIKKFVSKRSKESETAENTNEDISLKRLEGCDQFLMIHSEDTPWNFFTHQNYEDSRKKTGGWKEFYQYVLDIKIYEQIRRTRRLISTDDLSYLDFKTDSRKCSRVCNLNHYQENLYFRRSDC